jgi:PDZ domain-containing secreted protein
MSWKFNPFTGTLDKVGSGGSAQGLKERILAAADRTQTITVLNLNECDERISQIEYKAASVSPTATATKVLNYSATGYEYQISGVSWVTIP